MDSCCTSPQRKSPVLLIFFSRIKLTNKKHHGEVKQLIQTTLAHSPIYAKRGARAWAAMYLDRDCTYRTVVCVSRNFLNRTDFFALVFSLESDSVVNFNKKSFQAATDVLFMTYIAEIL